MRTSSWLSLFLWISQIVLSNGFLIHRHTKYPLPSTIASPATRPFSNRQQLYAAKQVANNNDDGADDDDVKQSKRAALRRFFSRIALSKRRRLRLRHSVAVLVAAAVWSTARPAAHAKFSYELNETPTHSLRPGMSKTQAEKLEEGGLDINELESSSVFTQPVENSPSSKQQATSSSKKASSSFDYGEEDDDEDDDEEDFLFGQEKKMGASQADQTTAQKLQAQTSREFAAYQKGKSRALYVKVGLCFFVPTYGFMIVREYVRRRREETYVQKGLEILEAQKAEYFNVTATSNDSDVEDELKGLKKNATSTDEDDDEDNDDDTDDDDDDDDDDDEDDEPRSRRGPGKPKRPSGDGGGDEGGDPGYGKPSDEDLDRLNKMFGKS